MSPEILDGSELNRYSGGNDRWPDWRLYVFNPNRVEIGAVVTGDHTEIPADLTKYTKRITISHNSGFESGDDPTFPVADIEFRRNADVGTFRRGLVDDGVICVIVQGDRRIRVSDWPRVFVGKFRGRPGDDTGTPSRLSESFTAHAYGREEAFLAAQPITSKVFEAGTDVGVAAMAIAAEQMGLGQNEIRFGAQGFPMRHVSNQIVDLAPLPALWNLFFTVGKKPRFNAAGFLVAIDADLDKPAKRLYSDDALVVSLIADPNDVEVNNRVVLSGLDATMTKVVQEVQRLQSYAITTGFFQSKVKKDLYYSNDRSQRAENTYVVPINRVKWADAEWTERDEFHGTLTLDTHYLRNARAIIFGTYLALQLTIAILDLAMQLGGQSVATAPTVTPSGPTTIAVLRSILQVASQLALAALLWSMNFIGHGEYEVWGRPYEFVYQQLVSEAELVGLSNDQLRTATFRNDLLSTMTDLDERVKALLRRELVKDQLYSIDLLDDLSLEPDDIIEDKTGDRYYITSTSKVLEFGADSVVNLKCWKIYGDVLRGAATAAVAVDEGPLGYGFDYGQNYGEGF